jgi:putative flippase GtrA
MNPSGYKDSFSPSDEVLLKRINKAKASLAVSISDTVQALRSPSLTVAKGVELIYSHLEDCSVAAKLAAAVVVIIVNYFISKLLVFTKKKPRGEL